MVEEMEQANCGETGGCKSGESTLGVEGQIPLFGFRLGLSLAIAGQSMVVGLGYNNALKAGESPAYGSLLYWGLHGLLLGSALLVLGLLGKPLFSASWRSLKRRRITLEFLFVLSLFGALGGSLISTITGEGSVYYEVVAVVMSVYVIGKQVTAVQREKALTEVRKLESTFQWARRVETDGQDKMVKVAELCPGDRVHIPMGEPIPVDGVVEKGTGYIRETAMTGEAMPRSRTCGDALIAGTWSVDGDFVVKVEAPQTNRKIDSIIRIVQEARWEGSRLQDEADRLMEYFVPMVGTVAMLTFAGWFFSGVIWWEALFNSMAVLLVACPCALGVAMPVGLWAGLFHTSQLGIVARNTRLLDGLSGAGVVVFDKTGTLSVLEDFDYTWNFSEEAGTDSEYWRSCVGSLERGLEHPLARLFARETVLGTPVESREWVAGEGVRGWINGEEIRFGEGTFIENHGLEIPEEWRPRPSEKFLYLAREAKLVGYVCVRERFRQDVQQVFRDLKRLDCQVMVLTGDRSGERLSSEEILIEAGLSPEEKADRVGDLERHGKQVLFIGDGINDVSAMQRATASLAIQEGSQLTVEGADGVFAGSSLNALPRAIQLNRYLIKQLRGNLKFALAYNVFGMGLAAGGWLHPVVAALLMTGSSFVVSWRAIQAAHRKF